MMHKECKWWAANEKHFFPSNVVKAQSAFDRRIRWNFILKFCPECGTELRTYEVVEKGRAIKCLWCEKISHNLMDIQERYCGNCKRYHERG
jgi:hypothetical protein